MSSLTLPDTATDPLLVIMEARNCSRKEARRWLTEEIDRRKRLASRSLKHENPFRHAQNGTLPPAKLMGSKAKSKEQYSPVSNAPHPRHGTRSYLIWKAITDLDGDRIAVFTYLKSLPEFANHSHSQLSTNVSTISTRYSLVLTPRRIPASVLVDQNGKN